MVISLMIVDALVLVFQSSIILGYSIVVSNTFLFVLGIWGKNNKVWKFLAGRRPALRSQLNDLYGRLDDLYQQLSSYWQRRKPPQARQNLDNNQFDFRRLAQEQRVQEELVKCRYMEWPNFQSQFQCSTEEERLKTCRRKQAFQPFQFQCSTEEEQLKTCRRKQAFQPVPLFMLVTAQLGMIIVLIVVGNFLFAGVLYDIIRFQLVVIRIILWILDKLAIENNTVKLFYYYTDEAGANGIAKSGVIIESEDTNKDAILGKGVYVTDLPPSTPDKEILLNNYDSAAKSTDQSNVSYYVDLQVPLSKLRNLVYDPTDNRRVFMHKGRIVLSDYNGTVYQR